MTVSGVQDDVPSSSGVLAYVTIVGAIGGGVIAHSLWTVTRSPVDPQWLWLVGLTVASSAAVLQLSTSRVAFSVAEIFTFTAVLLFGPALGALTVAIDCSVLSMRLAFRGRPLRRAVLSVTAPTLAMWIAAHLLFALVDVRSSLVGLWSSSSLWLPLTASATVYYLLDTGMIAVAIALDEHKDPWRVWRDHFAQLWVSFLVGAHAAGLIVFALGGLWLPFLALIAPVPLLLYYALRTWAAGINEQVAHLQQMNEQSRVLHEQQTLRLQTEIALRERDREFQAVFDSALDALFLVDDDQRVVRANPTACSLLHISREELPSLPLDRLLSLAAADELRESWGRMLASGEHQGQLTVARGGHSRTVEFSFTARIIPHRHLFVWRDVSQRRKLEDALFAEKERAAVTLHSIGDAVISTDVSGQVTYLNAMAERLTGWPNAEAVSRPLDDVLHIVDQTSRVPAEQPGARAKGLPPTIELGGNRLLIRRDGSTALVEDSASPIHDRDGKVTGAVIVLRDVTTERAQAMEMVRLAQYDVLTGLPNRTLFGDRIAQAIGLARRNGTRLAVLFVDLDRFKRINDSLGHALGDALLQSVTSRLLASVRASDTVGRRGGDEFVMLLADLDRTESAGVIADKIITAISEPHEILDQVVHITASVGIGLYPDDASDAEALIAAADTAMYHAKEVGRGCSQYFTNEMNVRSVARRFLEENLHRALRLREFVLHYQPKVDLTSSAVVGMEALIRWQHPTRGLLLPGEFVSVAEECGLIGPLGRWVLREACRQARAWQVDGLPALTMSVNVSAVEFQAKGFIDNVAAVLRDTDLAPEYLELELTESVLMAEPGPTTNVLNALKDLGVRLAIDDFGMGYSSLSYLSRFPIDTLKIDRSFVTSLTTTGHDAAIIHAIIAMGSSLRKCVVAEGVETAEQLELLQRHLCDQGQGYYFSRPIGSGQIADLLRRDPPLRTTASPSKH